MYEGKFDIRISAIIQKAFKIRNKNDYDDFYVVSREEAKEQIKDAEYFLSVIESSLDNHFNY